MPLPIQPIIPATLHLQEQTVFSECFGDAYWSMDGGIQETLHVFLSGNDLPTRWQQRRRFTIVETGFGTGLNFLLTWQVWRRTAPADAQLHYVSVDLHPFRAADLATLYQHIAPELRTFSDALLKVYPDLTPGFHRIPLDGGRVSLTLLWGDAHAMLSELEAQSNAFFLDGFAPDRNPQMWSEALCHELARLAAPGASLASYTVAGNVRRALTAAGFEIHKRPGFGRKREMLTAHFPGEDLERLKQPDRAIVIGSGIAGSTCAERLSSTGIHVTLIERRHTVACETSGNLAGIIQPIPSLDWNHLAQLSFAGFGHTRRQLIHHSNTEHPPTWSSCGVLRLAKDVTHAKRQERVTATGLIPVETMQYVDAQAGSTLCGAQVDAPGWWFPDGAWIHPQSFCRSLLHHGRNHINTLYSTDVHQLLWLDNEWIALDVNNRPIAQAPVVILANGIEARQFAPAAWLPLRPIRGQITAFPAHANCSLKTVVTREGYVTPALPGATHLVGATYEEGTTDTSVREADNLENIERLKNLVPSLAHGLIPSTVTGRAGIRTVSPDRRPVIGALPTQPPDSSSTNGLYALLGLGSRGLIFAPLGAELLTAQIAGLPWPIERSLAGQISAQRLIKST